MPDFQRFRRHKTKKAAMSPSSSPVPSSSTPVRSSPPRLTISTSTTPPRSSHSSHSPHSFIPPKSPFRNLKFTRSSHKRARSPAPASLQASASPAVVNHDGSLDHAMTLSPTPNRAAGTDRVLPDGRKIPAFLTLSEQDIAMKFADITWSEQIRTVRGLRDPSTKFGPVNPAFKNLNRYQNVQPWEQNRVKLQVPEGAHDYINASPILLESPLEPKERPPYKYIAMQGPKPNTQDHVWRMVSQQLESPAVIVMLTETHENAMEKCHPYFPDAVDDALEVGEDDEFGDGFRARVTCVGMEDKAHGAIVMRHLKLHVEGRDDDMDVWHLLYKKWPDFGVPALEDIDSFFELMCLSRAQNASRENPRVVHCSAGVGRTGTFIALEHLMREVESGDLEHYDEHNGGDEAPDLVFETVGALREQRKMMVQAESQYLFIYKVLRKLWMERYGVVDDSGEPASKRLGVDNDPFVEETSD